MSGLIVDQAPPTQDPPRQDPSRTVGQAGSDHRSALVDILRGLVIVLMVLDHTRDYFHVQALAFDPTDLSRTNPGLFATRWVTHLCAPTFVFLSGVSIRLQRINGTSGPSLSRYLVTRGLWLLFLEATVVSFGFNMAAPYLFLQVIWAIGVGMIAMAALVRLPPLVSVVAGVAIVGTAYLGVTVDPASLGVWGPVWTLLFIPGLNPVAPGIAVYPALPWFGIMCLGYGVGAVFLEPRAVQTRRLLLGAGAAIAAFVALRSFNIYGDLRPWSVQADPVMTVLSFLNVLKYPPTLQFGLLTLGVSIPIGVLLSRMESAAPVRALAVFGRTALFTYILHIYLVHGSAIVIGWAMGVPPSAFLNFLGDPSRLQAAGWGVSLIAILGLWAVFVGVLYPLASRYDRFKRGNRVWWTRYL